MSIAFIFLQCFLTLCSGNLSLASLFSFLDHVRKALANLQQGQGCIIPIVCSNVYNMRVLEFCSGIATMRSCKAFLRNVFPLRFSLTMVFCFQFVANSTPRHCAQHGFCRGGDPLVFISETVSFCPCRSKSQCECSGSSISENLIERIARKSIHCMRGS